MDFASQILYEDNHLLVINKWARQLVLRDKSGDPAVTDYARDYLKEKFNKPGAVYVGTPHRIDRPVSGILILARTSKCMERMAEKFRLRDIKKTYWALVQGQVSGSGGTLEHYLLKREELNKTFVFENPSTNRKHAVLHWKKLLVADHYTLLEVQLETGRHHQIRAQLSHIGFPIKGDVKYGATRGNADGSISLHSRQCAFAHPVGGQPLVITAPCPPDPLWQWCESNYS